MRGLTWGVGAGGSAGRAAFQANPLIGYAAMVLTVLIWAGFALSIRAIGASPLAAGDVALIRFGLPTLLLLPFLPSRWSMLRRVKPLSALMILAGAGLPFFFMASAGGKATSAAHVAALIAGTTPLSVALVAYALDRQRIGAARARAIAIILLGVMLLLVSQSHASQGAFVGGAATLLLASLLWGSYTLGLRRAGLDAIGCALLLSVPSFLVLVLLVSLGLVDSHIGHFTLSNAMPFLLAQGLGVGVISSVSYALAIRHLDTPRCSAIGSLAPALACLGAVPLLGESLTLTVVCGVAVITAGVILANRA
ncbi:EamA family transporter [Ralstonia sp. R-29]|uniref:EamA family transporter n=1 Tax=Ralstonia sp. R-29 TaxID=3404059 RepID=UPI003CEEC1D2